MMITTAGYSVGTYPLGTQNKLAGVMACVGNKTYKVLGLMTVREAEEFACEVALAHHAPEFFEQHPDWLQSISRSSR